MKNCMLMHINSRCNWLMSSAEKFAVQKHGSVCGEFWATNSCTPGTSLLATYMMYIMYIYISKRDLLEKGYSLCSGHKSGDALSSFSRLIRLSSTQDKSMKQKFITLALCTWNVFITIIKYHFMLEINSFKFNLIQEPICIIFRAQFIKLNHFLSISYILNCHIKPQNVDRNLNINFQYFDASWVLFSTVSFLQTKLFNYI